MVEDDEPVTIATGHWIERHVRSGVFAPVEPELALTILLGPAFAYGRLHVAHRAATSLATARAALVRAAWRGLAAD